ncbi:MAG: dihydrolipoyl dehydrogenase [Bacillota bacterium]|nr:dihydrolipoyl dehydrogenase [Bacillota bacterium]
MVVGEMAHERDVIIIGGGPGGYHAAIRASQLGKKVTLIEKEDLGGVCLNKGCIPSKVLTQQASRWKQIERAEDMGFIVESLSLNNEKKNAYRARIISELRKGVENLCKANKVEIIKGTAFFLSENRVGVEHGERYDIFQFQQAIIATGSTPERWQGISFDGNRILDKWSISFLPTIPEHLVIHGSDVISLEMAMAYKTLGAKVTIIPDRESLEFGFDSSIDREIKRIFKKEKITIIKESYFLNALPLENGVQVIYFSNGLEKSLDCSHLFISTPNKPNTEALGLERLGVKMENDGFIWVDSKCRTSITGIFAIGDATEGHGLAVKAIKQGKVAAEVICGLPSEVDLRFLPKVVHTIPPIATVGLTEEAALQEGYVVRTSQFPLSSNGFAALSGKKDGFMKIISEQSTDVILGIHFIGEGAVELISSGTLLLEMAAREEDLTFSLQPHPSLNEALLEAGEQLKEMAIHLAPKNHHEKVKQ